MSYRVLLLLLCSFFFFFVRISCTSPLNEYCSLEVTGGGCSSLTCVDFGEFAELDMSRVRLELDALNVTCIGRISLKASQPILFDDEYLDVCALGALLVDNYTLELANMAGFELTANPFALVRERAAGLLVIRQSRMRLFHRGVELTKAREYDNADDDDDDQSCNLDSTSNSARSLFAHFERVEFGDDVDLASAGRLCPIVFRRANMQRLSISGANDANRVQLSQMGRSQKRRRLEWRLAELAFDKANFTRLNHALSSVTLYKPAARQEDDSRELLDSLRSFRYASEHTFDVSDEPSVLFAGMRNLRRVEFELAHMEHFLVKTSWEWINQLNFSTNSELFELALTDTNSSSPYTYPDNDFCTLYEHFAKHARFIRPVIRSRAETLNCTCSLVWLLQNWQAASPLWSPMNTSSTWSCLNAMDKGEVNCTLKERQQRCEADKSTRTTTRKRRVWTTTRTSTSQTVSQGTVTTHQPSPTTSTFFGYVALDNSHASTQGKQFETPSSLFFAICSLLTLLSFFMLTASFCLRELKRTRQKRMFYANSDEVNIIN